MFVFDLFLYTCAELIEVSRQKEKNTVAKMFSNTESWSRFASSIRLEMINNFIKHTSFSNRSVNCATSS